MGGRHLCEGSILDRLVVSERHRLDLVLLAVLDIDAELGVPAQRGVDEKAAGDGLRVLAQVELLVDCDSMIQGVLNYKDFEDNRNSCLRKCHILKKN